MFWLYNLLELYKTDKIKCDTIVVQRIAMIINKIYIEYVASLIDYNKMLFSKFNQSKY